MNRMTTKVPRSLFSIFYSLLILAAPAAALELSLEENKGESGTIGYVDIDRVFKEYSGTLNAREEFLGEIKKKEESVNQRRHEIYTLKADIAKLKQEREFALNLPSLLATQQQMNAQPPAAVKPSTAAPSEVSVPAASTVPAAAPAQPAVPVSTSAALPAAPAVLPPTALPGMQTTVPAIPPATVPVSTEPSAFALPWTSTAVPAALPLVSIAAAPAAAPSVPAAAASVPVAAAAAAPAPAALPAGLPGLGIDMPGVAKVPVNYFKFSVSTAVPEIDAAVAAKENELKQKEESLKIYQRQVEKELLEYESHRSEILLGRIYIALKELAVKEEVSVIVDKRNILYGHPAVDLTNKLLEKLEAEQ